MFIKITETRSVNDIFITGARKEKEKLFTVSLIELKTKNIKCENLKPENNEEFIYCKGLVRKEELHLDRGKEIILESIILERENFQDTVRILNFPYYNPQNILPIYYFSDFENYFKMALWQNTVRSKDFIRLKNHFFREEENDK